MTRRGATPFALVVLSLGALFLSRRGSDVGRLPASLAAFVADLAREPLLDARALAETAGGLLLAGLVVLSWLGLGDILLRGLARLGRATPPADPPIPLALAQRCAFGAGAWSFVWFLLGVGRLYRPAVAVLALVAGLALAVMAARGVGAWRAGERDAGKDGCLELAAWAMLALPVALALVAALAPPTGKDALTYHRAVPKAYLAAGGIVELPENIPSYFALGAEMNGLWAMLLGGLASHRVGEVAFGAVLFAFFPLLLATVYGWARERALGRPEALLAAGLVAAVPTAYYVAANAYVDLTFALYVTLAMHAAARWWTTLEATRLAYLALAVGFALSVKLITVFVVFPLLLVVLLRARERARGRHGAEPAAGRLVLAGLAALAIGAALGSPWYLRTWVWTGSPLFPFYVNLWPASGAGWDAERSVLYQQFLFAFGGERRLLEYLAAPVRLSLFAQPEEAALYDGVLGISFLAGVVLVGWALWRPALDRELGIAAGAAAVYVLFWLASSQQLRFLLPALPAFALAIAGSTARRRVLAWILLATTLMGSLVTVAWFAGERPLRAVLGGESRADYLRRRLDYYPYYELIDRETPPTARVWLVNMRRDTYHLDRPHVSDYIFEDYTLRKHLDAARDVGDLRERARAARITHLLVRHDILLDPARSPVVDDRRTPAQNAAKLALLTAFLRSGRILRHDAKFVLVELHSDPSRARIEGAR